MAQHARLCRRHHFQEGGPRRVVYLHGHVWIRFVPLPILCRTIGHATVFDHMTGNISHLKRDVVLNLEDWQCLPSETTSPLHLCTLAGRKLTPDLPSTSLEQTGHAVTLIQKCASTGFQGWHKAMLLRLDKEELDAVKDETTTAEIRPAMVAKALNLTQTKTSEVLETLVLHSDLEEKKAMLECEASEDIVTDVRKSEHKGLLCDVQDETDGDVEELRTLLKTLLVKPKDAKKKSKLAEKVWPKPGEAPSASEVAWLQPPGARGWYDPARQRYQVFYKGSSCSTAFLLSCHRSHPMGVVHPSGHSQHGPGAKRAIRGLKMGVTGFVWYQLCMFLSTALEFGWLRSYFCEFLQSVRCAAYSVGGGDSHWRTQWKISSSAPRCTSFLRARFSTLQECVDTCRKPFTE